jgi:hypothetical protein
MMFLEALGDLFIWMVYDMTQKKSRDKSVIFLYILNKNYSMIPISQTQILLREYTEGRTSTGQSS